MAVKRTVKIKNDLPAVKAKITKALKIDLTESGDIIRQVLINFIDDARKRPKKVKEERYKGRYSKHIEDVLEIKKTKNGIGIGDIEKLDKEVPYWKVLNFGGYTPPSTIGIFTNGMPKPGVTGGSFMYTKNGGLMIPQKPIQGIHFIEKTASWIRKNMRAHIGGIIGKIFKDNRNTSLITLNKKKNF